MDDTVHNKDKEKRLGGNMRYKKLRIRWKSWCFKFIECICMSISSKSSKDAIIFWKVGHRFGCRFDDQ